MPQPCELFLTFSKIDVRGSAFLIKRQTSKNLTLNKICVRKTVFNSLGFRNFAQIRFLPLSLLFSYINSVIAR